MIKRASRRRITHYTAQSARRGAAEAERQRRLREQYGGNWFLAFKAARAEREAAAKAEADGQRED